MTIVYRFSVWVNIHFVSSTMKLKIIENAHFLLGNRFVLPLKRYYNKKYVSVCKSQQFRPMAGDLWPALLLELCKEGEKL